MSGEQRTLEDLQREIDELGATLDAYLDEVERRTGTAGLGLRQRMRKLEVLLAAPATVPLESSTRACAGAATVPAMLATAAV